MANHMDAIDLAFDWPKIDLQAAWDAGARVVTVYVGGTTDKQASAAFIAKAIRIGFGVKYNYEWWAGRAAGGAASGQQDATWAVQNTNQRGDEVRKILGYGPESPVSIDLSCDIDVTVQNGKLPAAIEDYYHAGKDVLTAHGYLQGAYAERDVIIALDNLGLLNGCRWQTYAWSGGLFTPKADLYQWRNGQRLGGAAVDFNQIINRRRLGVHWPQGQDPNAPIVVVQKPAPVPVPKPTPSPTSPAPTHVPDPTPAPPTPAPKPPTPASGWYYTVKRGDTLTAIAAQFDTTIAQLVSLNHLIDPNSIRFGQRLLISGRTYTVKAGDNLTSIAQRLGTTVAALVAANGISDPNSIRVGQILHY